MASFPANAITAQALEQLGQRFGIRYLFEGNPSALSPVAQGEVYDVNLPQALHLTLSDLRVERAYTSASYQSVAWFISVILEGEICAQIGHHQYHLTSGEGFCAHFDAQNPMTVHQPAQRRLRTVNLAVLSPRLLTLPTPPAHALLHPWTLPSTLQQTLCATIEQPASIWRQPLIWQGLALQLLGLGLPERESVECLTATARLSQRDRDCLARLHQHITQHPTADYRLPTMARDMAMSPSSLRQKFRACYGCSLFDYIRQARLAQAYSALESGYSVQQAAHHCGYQHASNFSTAFKRMFGIAPHDVAKRP